MRSRRRGDLVRGPSTRSVAADVDREIQAHLEMRAAELEAEGWEPEAALQEARRLFGDPDRVALDCRAVETRHRREVRMTRMIEAVWKDVRYALRALRRSPGFALVALVTLALGIGADTAVFSVVDAVLLRPLPYSHPERLVSIREATDHGGTMRVAWPNYQDWRRESTSFTGLTALTSYNVTLLGGVEPVSATIALVSADYWKVFTVQPVRGRLMLPADHVAGARPVAAVVSRSFWEDELGGRPLDALHLTAEGYQLDVVGVIPDGSAYPRGAQVWVAAEPFGVSRSRTAHNWSVVGRLAPGAPLAEARGQVNAITKRVVAPLAGKVNPDFVATGAVTVPLLDQVVGSLKTPLYLLLAAAALVLLVACTNVASTLLARGAVRGRELAVRRSLGAARGRMVAQLLTESFVLSLLGGAGGLGVAYLVLGAIRGASPTFLPRVGGVGLSPAVLLFAVATALATTVLFGVLPALRLSRAAPARVLRSSGRSIAGDGRSRMWRALVGAEVALALVLMVGSGLLVRSFRALMREPLGFDPSGMEVASLSLPPSKYPTPVDEATFYAGLLQRVRAIPGVSAAGVLNYVPIHESPADGVLELDGDLSKGATADYVVASGGAFRALGIPLLRGRLFDAQDGPGTGMVAIVSESFARRYWPGQNPIGKEVNGGGMDRFYKVRGSTFARVVGVVGDVRNPGRATFPTVYFPYAQRPTGSGSLLVKAATGDPARLAPALRAALRATSPDVPIHLRTLEQVFQDSQGERLFITSVMGGFSLLALILATVGIFGVVSYGVARRTREIGIRVALGAEPGSVLAMVVRNSMGMVGVGLAVGILASLVVAQAMRALLYGVGPSDPVTLAASVVLLGGAAVVASWIPARRGTRVDPTVAMRME